MKPKGIDMDKLKIWLSNAWNKIKENVPPVVRNYPYASVALLVAGAVLFWLALLIF